MTSTFLSAKTGEHFAIADLGPLSDLDRYTFEFPGTSKRTDGKVFLKQLLCLTSAEISINKLPPGVSIPFYHKHRHNEEIYIFTSGNGEFQVNGCIFPVTEGSVVRVDPEGERCLRNPSESEALGWITVQSRAGSHPDGTVEDGVGVDKRVGWVGKQRLS
jgi:mannose-6-phosphate isomerase-like protein (cupin superfamily)